MVGICGNDTALGDREEFDLPARPLMTLVLIKLNKIRFDMERYQLARILIGGEKIIRGDEIILRVEVAEKGSLNKKLSTDFYDD